MKRICELMPDDVFYLGQRRCKVVRISNGVLYFAVWYDGSFKQDTASNQLRARSKELVKVPDGEVVGNPNK